MIGSEIINIYRIDGKANSTIMHTSSGFYQIHGNGFRKVPADSLALYTLYEKDGLIGQSIEEAKSDMENCTLRTSGGDFISHHIDTPFLIIDLHETVANDTDYLDNFNSRMRALTNTGSFI